MTTNEQLAALGRVAMRLQNENNRLRDSLTEILERTGYFIKEANPRIYAEAQEALAIRFDRDNPDHDDSFMDRVSDDDDNDDDEEDEG